MPRRVASLPILVVAIALLAGCGGSGEDERPGSAAPVGATAKSCDSFAEDAKALRATAIPCERARQVMYGWQQQPSCALAGGASRGSCLTRSYRCQSVRSGRGLAVSCARAGESIAFVARRR